MKDNIDFESNEITWTDYFLRIGLGFGAVFQLICILALVFSSSEKVDDKSNQSDCSENEIHGTLRNNNNNTKYNQPCHKKSANHRKNRHEKKKRK